jgi:chaperone modulatory protein CbpM
MVNEGVLTPEGYSPETWRFNAAAVKRIQVTLRLQSDLRVNLPGAALALDLLEELEELRSLLGQVR